MVAQQVPFLPHCSRVPCSILSWTYWLGGVSHIFYMFAWVSSGFYSLLPPLKNIPLGRLLNLTITLSLFLCLTFYWLMCMCACGRAYFIGFVDVPIFFQSKETVFSHLLARVIFVQQSKISVWWLGLKRNACLSSQWSRHFCKSLFQTSLLKKKAWIACR